MFWLQNLGDVYGVLYLGTRDWRMPSRRGKIMFMAIGYVLFMLVYHDLTCAGDYEALISTV